MTGFDMSDLPADSSGKALAERRKTRIWKDAASSDRCAGLSDNQVAKADVGIPAHTVSVAYGFPDYHKVSDTADKIKLRKHGAG